MSTLRILKKRITVESGIAFGIIVVCAGLIYLLGALVEDVETEKQQLEGQVAGLRNQGDALRMKLNKFELNLPEYSKLLQGERQQELLLDRASVKPLLNQLQFDYGLEDLNVAMEPVKEIEENRFRLPRAVGLVSKGSLNFNTFTDQLSVGLVKALQGQMPAMVKITGYQMERTAADVSAAPGQNNANPLLTPQVRNTVEFEWIGLKDPSPDAAPQQLIIGQP